MPHLRPSSIPKVAFFLPHLGGGGAEKMMVTFANEFAARRYKVDMVLVQASGPNLGLLSEEIRVVDLGSANTFFSLPALVSYLRDQNPLVLLSSLDLTNSFALLARLFSRTKVRVVIRIESMLSSQRRVFWKKILEKNLLSVIYPRADGIIAVSQAVAKDAAKYTGIEPALIHTIYNPVITYEPVSRAKLEPAHPWFAKDTPPVILGVGRLTAIKDFSTLLKAFALVRSQRPAHLLILGEGEQRNLLVQMTRDLNIDTDVLMPGFVADTLSYMQRCRVFVLSSLSEGLPGALIEALASDCPVISTDCPGGAREILANGEYGDLVPVGDPDVMADAICKVLDGKIHHVNREWLEQFELNHVTDQTLKLLGLPEKVI